MSWLAWLCGAGSRGAYEPPDGIPPAPRFGIRTTTHTPMPECKPPAPLAIDLECIKAIGTGSLAFLVVEVPTRLYPQECLRLRDDLHAALKGTACEGMPIIVLPGGMRLIPIYTSLSESVQETLDAAMAQSKESNP